MGGDTLKEEYVGQYYPTEATIGAIGKVLLVNLNEKR
jgi:hypothetical protein